VPVGLGRGRKTGVFLPHLRDSAEGYGGFAGITRRSGGVLADKGRKTR
jgi:hypothetical protein